MNTANLLLLTQLALQAATRAQELTSLLARTQAENREPTEEELNALASADDLARARLASVAGKP